MEISDNFQKLDSNDIECDSKCYEAGSGANGDVIFGHHKTIHKTVAIKVFEVTGGHQAKALMIEKIKEEMEHLQKANHVNIVHVYGYVEWSFSMGIVMEYCRGGNLQTLLLNNNIILGIGSCLRMLLQTAKGIKACHELPDKRLIHGDLKSGNILLTEHLQIKIGDFGGAELATWSSLRTVNPLAKSKKSPQYTLYYTAPEKLIDLRMKPATALDIYAFAIVVYEVLAREVPYPPRDQRELLDLIKQGMRPDCSKIHDWIHTLDGDDKETLERLVQLMEKCWQQESSDRPASMTEVVDELEKLLQRQNPTNVQQEVEKTREQLNLNIPHRFNERDLVPLHQFSTRTRSFSQESTRHEITRESSIISTETAETVETVERQSVNITTNSRDIRLRRRYQIDPTGTSIQEPEPQVQPNITLKEICHKCFILIVFLMIALVLLVSLAKIFTLFMPIRSNEKKSALVEFKDKYPEFEQLASRYKRFIQEEKYEKTKQLKLELLQFVEQQESTTAHDLRTFAKILCDDKAFIEAFLFIDAASELYAKHSDTKVAADGIASCTKELSDTVEAMMKEGSNWFQIQFIFALPKQKRTVRDHVIPLMTDMQNKVKNLKNVNLDYVHLREVYCLYYIEMCQHYIGDSSSSKITIQRALQLMEKCFGDESSKHKIYSTLLSNLAFVSRQFSDNEQASHYAKKATEAEKQYARWNREEI